VAAEFVREAERAVHHAVVGEHDGIVQRAAANQAHGAKRLDIPLKAEGAGARQEIAERFGIYGEFDLLLTDLWMRKIHVAADIEAFGGIDADAAITFDDFERLENFKITAFAAQAAHAGVFEHGHEGLGGAIEDGDFDGIDVDENIVDAAGVDGREKMFGRREEHALFHQAGGVADARDVLALGFDGEIVEIDAAEDDAGVRGCGNQADLAMHAGMQSHAVRRGFSGNG